MSTKSINAELFRQLRIDIRIDENCMKKALDYIRKLAIQKEKAEFVSTLNEVCEQIKQAPTRQLQGRPLEEVLNEL